MNEIIKMENLAEVMQSVLIKGDLSKLTPQERLAYYNSVCKSIGLNPLTKPFDYIFLNGNLTLYARKDCTEQLRRIYGVSIEIMDRKVNDEVLVVHARAKDRDGRVDEDFGAVPFHNALKGEARSNAVMKAVTKAKRRVTLSICGLGFLDESEIDSIPTAALRPPPGSGQPSQDQVSNEGNSTQKKGVPEVGGQRETFPPDRRT